MSTRTVRLLALSLAAMLVVVTVGPIQLRPETGLSASLERFVGFLIVTVMLGVAYPARVFEVTLLMIGVAGLLEVLQLIGFGRHGRALDFLVKVCGASAGGFAALIGVSIGNSLLHKR
jgi:hypothetical protein